LERSDLIKRCQTGDKYAFEELYKLSCHQAIKTAYLISGQRDMAEDIVQEAFIQCYKEIRKLKEPDAFNSWFYKILIRCGWRLLSKSRVLLFSNFATDDAFIDMYFCLDDMVVTFSQEAKVVAAQGVDSIKTIFVVEKKDGHYFTVIKPIRKFQLSQGLSKKLFGVDDSSLGQKVGFKVAFPDTLDGYQLEFKAIGVKLDRKLDVDAFSQLGDRIQKAFDDDRVLESLKVYDAHRYSGACYRKGDTVIGIYVMSRTYRIIHNVIKNVTFQSCKGFWLEHPRNQYFKDKNTEVKNLQVRHSLFWVKNGRGFYLRSEGETDLTYHEAIQIADLFSKAY
jgi:Sigma-70 region 2